MRLAVVLLLVLVAITSRWFLRARRTSPRTTTTRTLDPRATWTREDVARHADEDDVWVIIDDVVYDLTEYAHEHPGGVEAILKNAGGDATKGFKGPQHPSRAFDVVEDYRCGVLATR